MAKPKARTQRTSRGTGTHVIGADLVELVDSVSAQVKRKGLSRVTLEMDGYSLEIANRLEYVAAGPASVPQATVVTRIAATQGAPPAASGAGAKEAPGVHLEDIVSPVTGTFYAAPGPGKPPFVKKSDRVKNGDLVCIVEAMKTMNRITSRYDGTVHSIEVANGDVVQTGQVLMRIEP